MYLVPVEGTETINVSFSAQFVVQPFYETDGTSPAGSSDFSDTLTLAAINVVDANGNPIPGVTIASSSGIEYTVDPEPATSAIVMLPPTSLVFRPRRGNPRTRPGMHLNIIYE
jgi:hypothetical protein